ncbi:hypothetical protein L1887_28887 [Cichorium endivia]|nr:hypothetical protein L1887_28887 [Cichorium endivia]
MIALQDEAYTSSLLAVCGMNLHSHYMALIEANGRQYLKDLNKLNYQQLDQQRFCGLFLAWRSMVGRLAEKLLSKSLSLVLQLIIGKSMLVSWDFKL